jgi:hypothetical protein
LQRFFFPLFQTFSVLSVQMSTKQFSMWLPVDAAARIITQVEPYGGSVGSFAAQIATQLSRLPESEQMEVRAEIARRIRRLEIAGVLQAQPAHPESPQTPAGTKTLLAQVDTPPRSSQQRRPGRGTKTSRAAKLHAEV